MAPTLRFRRGNQTLKATPVERVAGLGFFAAILVQVSFFIIESDLAAAGIMPLSPLQVSAANLARQYPGMFHYIDDVLLPGTWIRECLSRYLKCQFSSGGKGPCQREQAQLTDLGYIRNGTNLPLLVELLETQGMQEQQLIVYGCYMIVLSALFSLYYSVKTAVVGFLLLGYGLYKGNHIPLPPIVLVAFLCIYSGFNLGEPRGGGAQVKPASKASQKAAAGKQQQQQRPGGGSSSSGGQATPGKTPGKGGASARKQRKA